jgi:predicted transcriptional regulator
MAEDLNDEVIDALWCGAVRPRDIAERLGRGEVEICEALDHLSAAGLVVRHSEKVGDPHWELLRPQS